MAPGSVLPSDRRSPVVVPVAVPGPTGSTLLLLLRRFSSRGRHTPARRTERGEKDIAALFADLVGFTDHTERTDPEDSRRRLSSIPKGVPDTEAFVRSQ